MNAGHARCWDLAIVGCGGVSRMHLDGYAAHPEGVRVVAACDPDRERVEATTETYTIPSRFTSLDTLLDDAEFDVAVVCTPTPVREEVVMRLATAGKHVFCEKPLADSLAEARRIVAACEAAGVQLAVNQNFRYHYSFHIAKSLLEAGRLGDVDWIAHYDQMRRQDKGWRTQSRRHALSVMGVHWLDGFRWMLGDEPEAIHCTMHSSPKIDCIGETDAYVQIRFAGGAKVRYLESFSSDTARTDTHIWGERGILELTYDRAALTLCSRDQLLTEVCENPGAGARKPDTAFWGLDELLTAIEADDEPPNSGRDNLKTISLLEGAYQSAERGEWVEFECGELR